jgi:hypothetical protein
MAGHRKLIIKLAVRYQLPPIYELRPYATNGMNVAFSTPFCWAALPKVG